MLKKLIVIALLYPASSFSFATCGTCAGCSFILPGIRLAAATIKQRYDQMETSISNRYKNEIIPLEEDIELLETEVMRELAHTQALERKILFYEKGIVFETRNIKEMELTRSSAKKSRENHNKDNTK